MPKQQTTLSRQEVLVRQPFQGLDYSLSTEDLSPKGAAVARCRFEQGFVQKNAGRTAVGGTDSVPLNGQIMGLYNFKKLDSTQRLMGWTYNKVYSWAANATSWTDHTGSAILHTDHNPISTVTYVNKMYFTNGTVTDTPYYFDTTDSTITAMADTYRCRLFAVFGERLIFLNTYEGGQWNSQRMRWSNVGNTTMTTGDFVDLVSYMGDDEILGSAQLQTSLIIYGRRHILECSYTGSTTTPFAFSVRDANIGIASARVLFAEKSIHYFLSADGLYLFDLSLTSKPADQNIREWFLANCNKSLWTTFCLSKDELTAELCLYYTASGSSLNDKVLCLNTRTGVWTEDARSCTAVCYGGPSGQLTIDELSGTIDSQTETIDGLGSPTSNTYTFVGDSAGTVWKDWNGTNLGTSAVTLDYESKDFTFEDDGGTCWMALEFLAKGTNITVGYSSDEGVTWTNLTASTLTSSWTRYRLDFEKVSKSLRFRFYNNTVDQTAQLRWFRPYFLRTSSVGTLPT